MPFVSFLHRGGMTASKDQQRTACTPWRYKLALTNTASDYNGRLFQPSGHCCEKIERKILRMKQGADLPAWLVKRRHTLWHSTIDHLQRFFPWSQSPICIIYLKCSASPCLSSQLFLRAASGPAFANFISLLAAMTNHFLRLLLEFLCPPLSAIV